MSTFDLPSPALSSTGALTKSKKDKADKQLSWVWRWAQKRTDSSGTVRVYCMVKRCTQKNGYACHNSSTTNIRNHLINDHKLNANVQQEGSRLAGPLESSFNLGKRSAEQFTACAFERQFCKVLIRNQLAYSTVECPEILQLLKMAHSAPSQDDIRLPSNDTIARRVCQTANKEGRRMQ